MITITVEHNEETRETSIKHNTTDEIASDILELGADLILTEDITERKLVRIK